VYKDNTGGNLATSNLLWGKSKLTVKRCQISETQNLNVVEETSDAGGRPGLQLLRLVRTGQLFELDFRRCAVQGVSLCFLNTLPEVKRGQGRIPDCD
jgi:hypothetical protein